MELENCKRVVIVGNGSSSLKNKNGKFIDKSDVVIRIKSFVLDGFEDYVGTKTSIWFTKWFSFLASVYKNSDINLWLPYVDPNTNLGCSKLENINRYLFATNFSNREFNLNAHDEILREHPTVTLLTKQELEQSVSLLGITDKLFYIDKKLVMMHPTTYFYAIFLSLERFVDHKIYVTGFDGFTQGYYWQPGNIKKHNKQWPHYYTLETMYIKKLVSTNKITLI